LFIARASSENDKAPETEKQVERPIFPFGTQQDQVRRAAYAILKAMVNGKERLRTPDWKMRSRCSLEGFLTRKVVC
jgi:hypothetical protein